MDDKIIRVIADPRNNTRGTLLWRGKSYPCALGKGGVVSTSIKREGDGATPYGLFPLRALFFRSDRIKNLVSHLSKRVIEKDDGWCDDENDKYYNQLIGLPSQTSYETMWRQDNLYDVVIPLGYNDIFPTPGKGSAIFLHIAISELEPTEGCVAINKYAMMEILKTVGPDCFIRIYEN
jgi:L,D-peptidoglycan transpeptidase YkuD (ErfK/YbiS/YcfS/YnhG family)